MVGTIDRLRDPRVVRALVLRGLGAIYVSVFVSLWGQIEGLIGPRGILPATEYLQALHGQLTWPARVWLAPTLLWWSASHGALTALVVVGSLAGLAALAGPWPRPALGVAAALVL
jgi:hypothetical protein